jgi:hypothetical protein
LRRIQKKVEDVDRRARAWAIAVVDLLPKGLLMLDEENGLLSLFLAQQRRLNAQIDVNLPKEETPWSALSRVLPFTPGPDEQRDTALAAHRIVGARIESDIDRSYDSFCDVRGIDSTCEAAIDWRVAIRYLAQEVHRLASQINVSKEYYTSPHRFEIALRARDLAADIVVRREIMLDGVTLAPIDAEPELEPVLESATQ